MTSDADIHLERVTKRFGETTAVDDLTLSIPRGAFYALLGPSGCGKTTTLRMIGGFEDPTEGRVFLGGDDVTAAAALQARRQHGLPVVRAVPAPERWRRNVAFGLERKKIGKSEVSTRVGEALEMVQLGQYGKRKPAQLSGGQQQRVALARALVNRPRALLLDEPLGALDLRLRKQLQIELKRIQQDVGITFVHVTHDQEEAMTHGRHDRRDERRQDRAGRQRRRPLRAPAHRVRGELPRRLEPRRRAACAPRRTATRRSRRTTAPRCTCRATGSARTAPTRCGSACGRRRSRSPPPAATCAGGHNVLRGTVVVASFLGVSIQYVVRAAGGEELTVFAQNLDGAEPESLGPGREVQLAWDPQHTFVVAKERVA